MCAQRRAAVEISTDPYSTTKKPLPWQRKANDEKGLGFSTCTSVQRRRDREGDCPKTISWCGHNHRSRPLAGTQDGLWQSPTDLLSLSSQGCLGFQQGLGGDQQSLWLTKPLTAVLGAGKGALLWMWMNGVVAGIEMD